jgi:hypothetical protein
MTKKVVGVFIRFSLRRFIYSFFAIKIVIGGVEALSTTSTNGYQADKLAIGSDKIL